MTPSRSSLPGKCNLIGYKSAGTQSENRRGAAIHCHLLGDKSPALRVRKRRNA
jgi:hypothetical protein